MGDGRVAADDPVLRQQLARVYLEAELLKLVADRAISGELHGRPLGPESSIAKLVWSETEQHIAEVAAAVLGSEADGGTWGTDRVGVRSHTIAGGTTQVNKNIVAQRVLGLPR
jgi:alkylation response protein AidB-like acyl-CoA dehydrogenase